MAIPNKVHIPFKPAMGMVWNYAKKKLLEQIKAVAFIIIYLLAFKVLVLGETPSNSFQMAFGIGLVVLGLALFLEGLFLGLMPIGERVGIQLPQKTNIYIIMFFGLLLGFGATLAEPAISTLQHAGMTVTPWETPLLYRLLEVDTANLVYAVGIGVGFAVAAGMARFYYGIGIKPFIILIVPILTVLSYYFSKDPNLSQILNLAWDTGGVTTGPVTVPLVLAMGIGISKVSNKQDSSASSGFGVVTLASLLPVVGVFTLGLWVNSTTPRPMPESEFFSKAYRQEALKIVHTENNLLSIAFRRGTEVGRKAYFDNDQQKYEAELISLLDETKCKELLKTELSYHEWLSQKASSNEQTILAKAQADSKKRAPSSNTTEFSSIFKDNLKSAFTAVVPLVLLLSIVLVFMLRDKPKHPDEVMLGIIFSLIGMGILTSGIQLGFSTLGDQVGRQLPLLFQSQAHHEGKIILQPFDKNSLITAYAPNGVKKQYFYMKLRGNNLRLQEYFPEQYNENTKQYEYIVEKQSKFNAKLTLLGIALVFLFAFGMGYGSTIAEPALSALGTTVEGLTVGTIKRKGVVGTVSLGVGLGLLVGVARIIYNIDMIYILAPAYILSIFLTFFVDDDYAGIAWDAGGVTTGPITVPLVLAMGLGIGGGLNIADGFGIVAMASVFPILTMLLYGIIVKYKQHSVLNPTEEIAK